MIHPSPIDVIPGSHATEHHLLLNQNRYAATIVLKILDELLPIDSVLDLGCGIGVWMQAALAKPGRDVMGVEIEPFAPEELLVPGSAVITTTLELPFDLQRRFDMVLCIETAEHIAEASASNLVLNCVRHSNFILFSAAIPGQGGLTHINNQPPEYWRDLFDKAGYSVVDFIRPLIWHDTGIPAWYRQNMLLFVNRETVSTLNLLRAREHQIPIPLHRAHPDLLEWQASELAQRQAALEQAELRIAELQEDLEAQREYSGRVISQLWELVNRLRSECEPVRPAALEQGLREVQELQEALVRAKRDAADLRNSLSWRVTAPLRALGQVLLRVRKREPRA